MLICVISISNPLLFSVVIQHRHLRYHLHPHSLKRFISILKLCFKAGPETSFSFDIHSLTLDITPIYYRLTPVDLADPLSINSISKRFHHGSHYFVPLHVALAVFSSRPSGIDHD